MRCASVVLGFLLTACPTAKTPAQDATPEPSPEREALRTRCADAVEAVTFRVHSEQSKPKDAERTVIESLNEAATEVCVKEGLTDVQSKCFEAVVPGSMGEGLESVRTCLGGREQWPSWFSGAGVQL